MDAPIYDGIKAYNEKKRISFHMPGHKGNIKVDDLPLLDITELTDTDDLHSPTSYIKKSEEMLGDIYGTKKSFYLLGGATCGIYSMIASCLKPGDKLIVDRNCHKSVINALILIGIDPVYIVPDYCEKYGFFGGIGVCSLKNVISQNRDAKAVIITSPTYYGVVSDIKKIADEVHKNDMLLFVDEAHGAHFNFSPSLPESSVKMGADMTVQSVHKTLGSFSGGALLHINSDRVCTQNVRESISVFMTSSPSYAMLSVLEKAVVDACSFGEKYDMLIREIDLCMNYVNSKTNAYWVDETLTHSCDVYDKDKTRIVINFEKTGFTGFEVSKILHEKYNITTEMCDDKNIVCIATPYNDLRDITALKDAVINISKRVHKNIDFPKYIPYEINVKSSPRDAFYSDGDVVDLSCATGRISKKAIYKYPPGIPFICPGEEITDSHIEELNRIIDNGENLKGIHDKKIEVVK